MLVSLRNAASNNNFFALRPCFFKLRKKPFLRIILNSAGVKQDHVCFVYIVNQLVAGLSKKASHYLRVRLVKSAAKSTNEDFHGSKEKAGVNKSFLF